MKGSKFGDRFEQQVAALCDPKSYDDVSREPTCIQTHISAVFLTSDHVYKLKKPVDFGFLDFSTLQRRKEACEAEVEVNRRLAPDIYEGVVALNRDEQGRWLVEGEGETMDWLVKMKRLPDDRCLKNLLHSEEWNESESQAVSTLVDLLARFYQSLSPIAMDDYVGQFVEHVNGNAAALSDPRHKLSIHSANRSSSLQRWFLFAGADELNQRCDDGRIVEGHGDLRAEHLYLTDPPVALDGIEFDRHYRLVDIADELCFLAITCEFEHAAEVGQVILGGVCSRLDDRPSDRLLDFYRAYRASVRAKVAALRAAGENEEESPAAIEEARRYLEMAEGYARRLGQLPIIVVRGLSGTGKTTLATRLASEIGAHHLATDNIRRQMDDSNDSARYSSDARNRVYETMVAEAKAKIEVGQSVILDGTFLQPHWLEMAIESLRRPDASTFVITCRCPVDVAMERVETRAAQGDSSSDADAGVLRNQSDQVMELPLAVTSITVDTNQSLDQQVAEVRTWLNHLL